MSIIDDALKGVERAQSQDEQGSAVTDRPAPRQTQRFPRTLVFGLLIVAVVAGGWVLSSMFGLTDQAEQSTPVVAETDLEGDDWETDQEVAGAEKIDRSAEPSGERETELAAAAADMAITNPAGDAPANEVAALTDSVVGLEGDANDVSRLTEDDQSDLVSPGVADELDEVSQLTATADSELLRESVAELTEGTSELSESTEVLAVTDRGTVDSSVLAALTAPETASTGVEPVGGIVTDRGSADMDQPDESVASLTAFDETDPAISAEIGAGMDGQSVAELTELTSGDGARMAPDGVATGIQNGTESGLDNPTGTGLVSSTEASSATTGAAAASSLNRQVLADVSAIEAITTAKAAEARGDYSAALAALATSNSNDRDLSLHRARLLARLGRFEESGELASGFNEESMGASDSFWLGYARFNLAQWQPAVRALSRAAQLNTGDPLAALYLGMAQQQSGDYLGSIDSFHQARQLRPDMPEIAFNTGISWWALGERERAQGAFRHFMRITDGQRQTYAEQRRRVANSYLGSR